MKGNELQVLKAFGAQHELSLQKRVCEPRANICKLKSKGIASNLGALTLSGP